MDPIKHTMLQIIPPYGMQIVNWPMHSEIRFLKADGQKLLVWWREQLERFEREIPGLCEDKPMEKCPDCTMGRKNNGICPSCSGSGIKGFVVPGKEKAPITQRSLAPVQQFSSEVLAQAQRIVDEQKQSALQEPTIPAPQIDVLDVERFESDKG